MKNFPNVTEHCTNQNFIHWEKMQHREVLAKSTLMHFLNHFPGSISGITSLTQPGISFEHFWVGDPPKERVQWIIIYFY